MFLAAVLMLMSETPAMTRQDTSSVDLVDQIDAEWSEIFQARGAVYTESTIAIGRIMYGGLPHPPSYVRLNPTSLGIIMLDDRFPEAAKRSLPKEASALNAFIIAHEIGHHVQAQRAQGDAPPPLDGPSQELQADCYAGAILARINQRTQETRFNIDSVSTSLPEFLRTLAETRGSPERPAPQSRGSHGFDYERIAAIRTGATAADPAVCET